MFEKKLIAAGGIGFKLVSEYSSKLRSLTFKCPQGHEFVEQPSRLLSFLRNGDLGCLVCKGEARRKELEHKYKDMISKWGFKCKAYVNNRTPILHKCASDHTFMLAPMRVRDSIQCPSCFTPKQLKRISTFSSIYKDIGWSLIEITRNPGTATLPARLVCNFCDMQLAFNVGSKKLTPCKCQAVNCTEKKVKRKHIPKKGTPKEKTRVFKEILKATLPHIELKGEYTKSNMEVQLKCNKGHTWKTLPNNVLSSKVGCPVCGLAQAHSKTTKSHAQYSSDCLSVTQGKFFPTEHYINDSTPITHSCACGTVSYKIKPNCVLNGNFRKCHKCNSLASFGGFSHKACLWLDMIEEATGMHITHAKRGKEKSFRIDGNLVKVDGFCKETNTVYEFLGDDWHGAPFKKHVRGGSHHPHKIKSDARLFYETMLRLQKIAAHGYNVVYVWQSSFDLGEIVSGTFNATKR